MNIRLIEYLGDLFIVLGIGYEMTQDPPDIFYCVRLEGSLVRSVISEQPVVKIPLSEAIEITDKRRLKTIIILFGTVE